MAIQNIYRGITGNPSATFAIGDALTTAQQNDQYLNDTLTSQIICRNVELFGAVGDGVTDDWAAFDRCRAAGYIGNLQAGKSYYMSTGHNIGAGLGFICIGGRATIIMSRAGFSDSTYSALTQARCCFIWTSVDNPICKNITFQFEAGSGIRTSIALAVRNCTNLDIDNLQAFGFGEARGGIFTVDSCTGGRFTGGYVHDCTTNSTTLPSMQITGLEVDNNRVSSLYSSDIDFGLWRFKNIYFGASALATYGFQTDGVTFSGGATSDTGKGCRIAIFADNVYEPFDCQSSNHYIDFVIAKNCVYGVKFVHAARNNRVDFASVENTYSFGVVFGGSNTASETNRGNSIGRVVVRNIGSLGGALQKAAVAFDGASATYKPTDNIVESLTCYDTATMNFMVYAEAGTRNSVKNCYTETPLTSLASIIAPAKCDISMVNDTYVDAYLNANTVFASGNPIIFDNEILDTLGEYNPATGIFTSALSGRYQVSACTRTSTLASGGKLELRVTQQSTEKCIVQTYNDSAGSRDGVAAISTTVTLDQGEIIRVFVYSTVALTLTGGQPFTTLRIVKLK